MSQEIQVRDKDGELVERQNFGWSMEVIGPARTWGLQLGDQVEVDGHIVLRVTSEQIRLRRPPPVFRLARRRLLNLRRKRRRHGRPRGR